MTDFPRETFSAKYMLRFVYESAYGGACENTVENQDSNACGTSPITLDDGTARFVCFVLALD